MSPLIEAGRVKGMNAVVNWWYRHCNTDSRHTEELIKHLYTQTLSVNDTLNIIFKEPLMCSLSFFMPFSAFNMSASDGAFLWTGLQPRPLFTSGSSCQKEVHSPSTPKRPASHTLVVKAQCRAEMVEWMQSCWQHAAKQSRLDPSPQSFKWQELYEPNLRQSNGLFHFYCSRNRLFVKLKFTQSDATASAFYCCFSYLFASSKLVYLLK